MSVELPQPRLPQIVVMRFLDFGGTLTPPGGGAAQRVNRLGSRFGVDITYPRLRPEPDARILMSALRQAKVNGAIFPVPQPGFDVGAPGNPLVDGAAQLGTVLKLKGFTPGYAGRNGQYFSIIQGGRRYLHHLALQGIADAAGGMEASIWPMLRISPDDGAICEFGKPMIEGFLAGNTVEIELSIAKGVPSKITIEEAA